MRKLLLAAAVALVSFASVPATAQSQNGPYIGQLILVSFNFCPAGWHAADGALLQISQNVTLFSLIGTTYGGNGTTTFALPKVAAPLNGMLYCINLQTGYKLTNPNAAATAKPKH